jgi:hypothetical protein
MMISEIPTTPIGIRVRVSAVALSVAETQAKNYTAIGIRVRVVLWIYQ